MPSGMLLKVDRRVGAGAEEPLGQTLPDDQLGGTTVLDDRSREPSVVPDGLRTIHPSADEVGNVALVWCRR